MDGVGFVNIHLQSYNKVIPFPNLDRAIQIWLPRFEALNCPIGTRELPGVNLVICV